MQNNFLNLSFAITYLQSFLHLFWAIFKTIVREFWWLIIFFILGLIFFRVRKKFLEIEKARQKEIKDWVLLEIITNPKIMVSPKAMEQVFNGIYALSEGYLALELVGFKKEIKFFLRVPQRYQKVVMAQLYAQYPDIEIKEVQDYFLNYPPSLPNKNYDIWGTEIKLANKDVYPLKTYPYFEEIKEERRIDPLSSFIEGISQLKESELLVLQLIIQPLSGDKAEDWRHQGREEIDKLSGKTPPRTITWPEWIAAFFKNLIIGIVQPPVWPETSSGESKSSANISLTNKEKIKYIAEKISQIPFNSGIRLLYLAPRVDFNEISAGHCYAFLNQFSQENLNSFRPDSESATKVKGNFLKNRRLLWKKFKFYQSALKRSKTKNLFVLTSKELATLYHCPFAKVKSPSLVRTLFRKSEPPSNLPI